MNEGKEISLRYFAIDAETAASTLLLGRAAMRETVVAALGKLGIVVKDGEEPLAAWTRAMSEENGLPFTQPCHAAIADAIMQNPDVMRFVFAIA